MNKAGENNRSTKEKFWQGHIDRWKSSGLSQQVYCQNNLLVLATFGYWRRKLQVSEPERPHFYPLAVSGALQSAVPRSCDNSIRLVLDGNRFTIEIDDKFSPSTLQRLILALEQI